MHEGIPLRLPLRRLTRKASTSVHKNHIALAGNLGRPGSESDREESSGGNSDSEGQQTDDAGRTDSEEDDDEEDTNNWGEDNEGHVPQGTKSRPASKIYNVN